MTPAELDALIHSRERDGQHGERNCPKCSKGYMAYQVTASSHVYVCVKCNWLEFRDPPWSKKR